MKSVVVAQPGAFLGKTSERLVVRAPKRPELEVIEGGPQLLLPIELPHRAPLALVTDEGVVAPAQPLPPLGARPPRRTKTPEQIELPLFELEEIVIAGRGVTFSSDLLQACCERGIRLVFLEGSGRPYALLSSPDLGGTAETRRAQLAAYGDGRGTALALAIVSGKLRNQAALLAYFGKYVGKVAPAARAGLSRGIRALGAAGRAALALDARRPIDEIRDELMGSEGAGARAYWEAVALLLRGKAEFPGRTGRGAQDPVNAALNYGYGLLYARVWGAALLAGLDPFAGFLHADRPGKPSLVLDLIEEFRPVAVDRAVLALVRRGTPLALREGLLDPDSRQAVAAAVLDLLAREVTFRGARRALGSCLPIQAREAAAALRGERAYRPLRFKW